MLPLVFEQTLADFTHRAPFEPFTVELVNGEQIMVDHPEAIAYRASRAVFVSKEGRLHVFDPDGVNHVIGPAGNGNV